MDPSARPPGDEMIPSWAMELADVAVQCARQDPRVGAIAPWIEERLRSATHVHAQNVADYFWLDSLRECWDLTTHIASARCPWKAAWITYRRPAASNREGTLVRTPPELRHHVGMLHEEAVERGQIVARSLVFMALRLKPSEGSLWRLTTLLDEEGAVVAHPHSLTVDCLSSAAAHLLGSRTQEVRDGVMQDVRINRTVALLTCAFANCRNVEAVGRTYVPRNKKAARRGEYRGQRYYVLGINPVTTPRSPRRADGEGGAGVSYHLCRGHFADYRKGRGLFGRYHGRFWVPQHTRGRREVGEVEKDYAVLGGGPAPDQVAS